MRRKMWMKTSFCFNVHFYHVNVIIILKCVLSTRSLVRTIHEIPLYKHVWGWAVGCRDVWGSLLKCLPLRTSPRCRCKFERFVPGTVMH